jgi:hypothetical protein
MPFLRMLGFAQRQGGPALAQTHTQDGLKGHLRGNLFELSRLVFGPYRIWRAYEA